MAFQSLDFTGRLQCPSTQSFKMCDVVITSWQNASLQVFKGVRYIFNHWTALIEERLSVLILVVSGGYWFKASAGSAGSSLPYQNLHLNQKKYFLNLTISSQDLSRVCQTPSRQQKAIQGCHGLGFKFHNISLREAQSLSTSLHLDVL